MKSPDGAQVAAIDLLGCGATVEDVSWILVAPADDDIKPDRHQVAILTGKAKQVRWLDNETVLVSGDVELFRQTSEAVTVKLKE